MPTELPIKVYMWKITVKKKELFDFFEKEVCVGPISAFGLRKSSFFVFKKSCFWYIICDNSCNVFGFLIHILTINHEIRVLGVIFHSYRQGDFLHCGSKWDI